MPRVLIPAHPGHRGRGELTFHYGEGLSDASEVALIR